MNLIFFRLIQVLTENRTENFCNNTLRKIGSVVIEKEILSIFSVKGHPHSQSERVVAYRRQRPLPWLLIRWARRPGCLRDRYRARRSAR